jgi:hypothetical protein
VDKEMDLMVGMIRTSATAFKRSVAGEASNSSRYRGLTKGSELFDSLGNSRSGSSECDRYLAAVQASRSGLAPGAPAPPRLNQWRAVRQPGGIVRSLAEREVRVAGTDFFWKEPFGR